MRKIPIRKITVSLIPLIIILMVGCSTTPITKASGHRVPKEMIYDHEITKLPSSKDFASVGFLRDRGYFGGCCTHLV